MKINVYGTGCARCASTEKTVLAVVHEMGIDAHVEKISDIRKILAAGVLSTPALSIDGKLVCTGREPSAEEITGWIRASL